MHSEREFTLDYIMVVTTVGGQIVGSRDYLSLVQAAQAMGMTQQLIAALSFERHDTLLRQTTSAGDDP